MAATQVGNVNIMATMTGTLDGRSTAANITSNRQLSSGTTAGAADKTYYKILEITTGYPQNLDLAGGGLIDINGEAVTFVEVTTFIVRNLSTTVAEVVTVGGGSNPFNFGCGTSGTKSLKAPENAVLIDCSLDPAYTVTAGTGDNIQFAVASGTLVRVEVMITGRSA